MSRPRAPHARIPALDGVRGLAVAAVLLFHGGVSWLRGGFLGVDAFFALSGYLITALLLAEVGRSGRVDLARFWRRRVRRLLPALVTMLLAVVVVAGVTGAADPARLHRDALAALLYVANWRQMSGGSYFQQGQPSLLEHTWSLGIEEQFYLVWPLVVLGAALVLRTWHRKALALLAAAGAGTSAWVMAVLWSGPGDTGRAYYGTDTRAQALLVGALLAAVLSGRTGPVVSRLGRTTLAVASWAGLGTTAWLWSHADGSSSLMYHGGFALAAVAATALVAEAVLVPSGVLTRLLSVTPLALLGRISYGVYLWHWPLFLALDHERTGATGVALLLVRIAATMVVASVSYLTVEQSMWRQRVRSAVLARPALAGVAAVLVAGGVTAAVALPRGTQPGPAFASTSSALLDPQTAASADPSSPAAASSARTSTSSRSAAPATKAPGTAARTTRTTATTVPATPRGQATRTTAAAPATHPTPTTTSPVTVRRSHGQVPVLVVGDSVSMTLAYGIRADAATAGFRVIDAGQMGCGVEATTPYRYFGDTHDPVPGCVGWDQRWAADLRRYDPAVTIVMVGRWEIMDRLLDGHWTRVGEAAYDQRLVKELNHAVDVLTTGGRQVVFATPLYDMRGERPDGGIWPEDQAWRIDTFISLLRKVAAQHPTNVTVADITSALFPMHHWQRVVNGVELQQDGVHLTVTGAKHTEPVLFPVLRRLTGG